MDQGTGVEDSSLKNNRSEKNKTEYFVHEDDFGTV